MEEFAVRRCWFDIQPRPHDGFAFIPGLSASNLPWETGEGSMIVFRKYNKSTWLKVKDNTVARNDHGHVGFQPEHRHSIAEVGDADVVIKYTDYRNSTQELRITCLMDNDRAVLMEKLTRHGFIDASAQNPANVGSVAADSFPGSHSDGEVSAAVLKILARAGSRLHESEPEGKRRKIEDCSLVQALRQEKKLLEEEVNEKRGQIAKLLVERDAALLANADLKDEIAQLKGIAN